MGFVEARHNKAGILITERTMERRTIHRRVWTKTRGALADTDSIHPTDAPQHRIRNEYNASRNAKREIKAPKVHIFYHSNELSRVNTLYEHNLCSSSRTREQSFVSIYHTVNIYNIVTCYLLTRRVIYVGCGFYARFIGSYIRRCYNQL
jgi:hypothetical protein